MPWLAALVDTVWSRCFEEVVPGVAEPIGPVELSPDTHAISYIDRLSSPGISDMANNADSDQENAV